MAFRVTRRGTAKPHLFGRPLGRFTFLLLLAVSVVAFYVLLYVFDALTTAPWAYGWLEQPTLTGDWTGSTRTHSGVKYAFYLHLARSHFVGGIPIDLPIVKGSNGNGGAEVFGKLSWCTSGGPTRSFTVDGYANYSASNINLEKNEDLHPRSGLSPDFIHAVWHGSTLSVQLSFSLYRNNLSTVSDVMTLSLTMRKQASAAFQGMCSSA